MCRNIRTLGNFEPPATDEEVRLASVQFVRKISGMRQPSRANTASFDKAVADVSDAVRTLLSSLQYAGQPKNREEEARKAKKRTMARFGA